MKIDSFAILRTVLLNMILYKTGKKMLIDELEIRIINNSARMDFVHKHVMQGSY